MLPNPIIEPHGELPITTISKAFLKIGWENYYSINIQVVIGHQQLLRVQNTVLARPSVDNSPVVKKMLFHTF